MNYLAHSYLSFTDLQIVGQFLEDYIKNNQREQLPIQVQQGILLHRAIDTFTDGHLVIKEAKKIFQPLVRLYSGAFIDVSFDYFLANSLEENVLKNHTQKVYKALENQIDLFPDSFKNILGRMKHDDWLFHYRDNSGMKHSFQNVLNKAIYLEKDFPVFDIFIENKAKLKVYFDDFFPELEMHCQEFNQKF